jgi:hypothetical protein
MTEVEEVLIQTKAKSGQDVLNYPIRLNNELVALAGSISSADAAPTQQSYDVFSMLKQRSDEHVSNWEQVVKSDIASFNQLVQQQAVPAIIVNSSGAAGPPPAGPGSEELDQN